jgi:hypothetical protein
MIITRAENSTFLPYPFVVDQPFGNGCLEVESSCLEACLETLSPVAAVAPADTYQHIPSIAKENTAQQQSTQPP